MEDDTYYICTNCGKIQKRMGFEMEKPIVRRMEKNQLCFDCQFWMDFIKSPIPETKIVSGQVARIETKPVPSLLYASKNRTYVQSMKTKEISEANKLRFMLHIPPQWQDYLPDEYRVISFDTFKRIFRRPIDNCDKKGCFDRHFCYWYSTSSERNGDEWNTLPKNYKPGSEECESFINKNTMYEL